MWFRTNSAYRARIGASTERLKMMTVTTLAEGRVDVLAAKVLAAAGDRIERCGFGQGAFFNNVTGLYCTVGAITMAAQALIPGRGNWEFCGEVIDRAVYTVSLRVGNVAALWNDVPGRTQDEVVDALRGSARELLALAA